MKKTLSLLLLSFSLLNVASCHATESSQGVTWHTNYPKALAEAKESSKPLVLFFTGSDWCGWCSKLVDEALSTQEFARSVGDQFIFVELDFPMGKTLPENIKKQNEELKEQFHIKGYPTIVILTNGEETIGVTGYQPGGGSAYANHLKKIASDYSTYQRKTLSP